MAAVILSLITWDLIKSLKSAPHSDTRFFLLPLSIQLHPTHTFSPLSQCGVHTSRFSIPATKPQQQGGNDPATTAVMMESVGGLAGSLTLPNKSPNNSVNIGADPATRSNALTHGRPPRMTLGNLSVRLENCCWPARCELRALLYKYTEACFGPQNTAATINATQNILILLSCIHSLTICVVDRNLWKACCSWKNYPKTAVGALPPQIVTM